VRLMSAFGQLRKVGDQQIKGQCVRFIALLDVTAVFSTI
jgi:hypothetical protein